jgi:glycosyltransferase involved in cell wall biosynthesis
MNLKKSKKKVIVTLPAYRAEKTLERTVDDIPRYSVDQIILVDDASPDNTVKLSEELGLMTIVHEKNLGYGGNQKTCYVNALKMGADVVVCLHPDYQYSPKMIPFLIEPLLEERTDFTFGSRWKDGGKPLKGGMPIYRFIGNIITTKIENALLGTRFTEMHSGLKAYTRDFLLGVPFLSYSNDFFFDTQILVNAILFGYRIEEVAIPTRYTLESSSTSISASFRYIFNSIKYSWRVKKNRSSEIERLKSLKEFYYQGI